MKAKSYSPKASNVRALQYTSKDSAKDIVAFVLEHANGVVHRVSPYGTLYLTIEEQGQLALIKNDYLVYDGQRFTFQNAGFFEAKYEED